MQDKRMRIRCGIRRAPTKGEFIAVMAIRPLSMLSPDTVPVALDTVDLEQNWEFSGPVHITHCAVTKGYDPSRGRLQARFNLSCTLDLLPGLPFNQTLDDEEQLSAGTAIIGRLS